MAKSDAESESEKYTSMLNLVNKRNVIVTNLSGGMKRKVNLGIALIGDSKVTKPILRTIFNNITSYFAGCHAG